MDDSWIGSRFYFRSIRPEGYCESEGASCGTSSVPARVGGGKGGCWGCFPLLFNGGFNGHGSGALVIPGEALRMLQCCRRRR